MNSQGIFLDRFVSPPKVITCSRWLHNPTNHFAPLACVFFQHFIGAVIKGIHKKVQQIYISFLLRRHCHIHKTYLIAKYQKLLKF